MPVGDYMAEFLRVEYGPLELALMHNMHSEGHRCDRQGKPYVRGFKIRKSQPFVLDFSSKPEVIFTSPGRDRVWRRGETG